MLENFVLNLHHITLARKLLKENNYKEINVATAIPSRGCVNLPMGKSPKTSPALISGGRAEGEAGFNITLVKPERIHCVANTERPADVTFRPLRNR